MRCPRCQAENDGGGRFCEDCGAPLEAACPSCGTPIALGKKFCWSCGAALSTESASRFASAESYTPKHLAEKILTSRAALEGERKQVTVLFADLKGSMELLADRDPEDARTLLDPVLEHMMEAVHRYEGTVNQVMGDGIMALFGAPLAHEDHAVRACYAALRMQESVKKYAEEVRRSHAVEIKVRVGLNSGEVVVRAIGSDLQMDYTAVGQTTHLAARMEQLADPGAIVITPETLARAAGYVEVKPLGPVPVQGLAEPVEVFEVTGAGLALTRLQAAVRRGLTRFVGRDAELEQLRRAQQLAANGHGQIVAIIGEAGIGKSRLVYEFTHSHRLQGWLILQSRSVSYARTTSYLPVIDLLKAYFKVHDQETHREIREKIIGKLLTLDRALEPTLPAFLALLDVPVEDARWEALDPPQRRRRTLDAVKRLLLRESQRQPLLVIFEDLHWIDAETGALLDGLIDSLPTARFLLLVNYRPEYQHGWGSRTYYTQLRLDALRPESADELVLALLGTDTTVEPLTPILLARTGGNPLFLEESVRTLVETNALAGERGAYRLARPVEAIDVPATAQAILASRIDRLDPQDKQLLQTASVVGNDVPFALLLAIAELPEEDLHRGLAHLQAAEFLYEARLYPDLEYTFKHALTHEVAYGSLLQERRRALHARILAAMESLQPDRLIEDVDRLAHHAFRGQVWDKALAYLRRAGVRAFARSGNRQAVLCFEQALAALGHLPESGDAPAQAIDVRFELRSALQPLGDFGTMLQRLQEAERLAGALGDERRLGWALAYLADCFRLTGNKDGAIASGEQALGIAERLGDLSLQVTTNTYIGQVYQARGSYRRAAAFFRTNVETLTGDLLVERFGSPQPRAVHSRTCLVWCLAELGEFPEGIARGEEAVAIARSLENPFSLVTAYAGLGDLYLRQGDAERALSFLTPALELLRAANSPLWFPIVGSSVGAARALAGHPAEGVHLLQEAVERAVAMNLVNGRSLLVARLGEGHLLAGQLHEAHAAAERALQLAQKHDERGFEGWAWHLLAEIGLRIDPGAMALDAGHRALGRAEELGMRPLAAHCHLGLGKLYRRTGKSEQAHDCLSTATTMYREMDMRFWLEQAEAEIKGLA